MAKLSRAEDFERFEASLAPSEKPPARKRDGSVPRRVQRITAQIHAPQLVRPLPRQGELTTLVGMAELEHTMFVNEFGRR